MSDKRLAQSNLVGSLDFKSVINRFASSN